MDLKEKIKTFPKTPGIYLMKDSNGDIIYIGKSKRLQDRIKSYFVNSNSHSRKVQRMVKGIFDIDIIQTDTELDALLLECDMIKKIRPMYNKLMRNPENYVYLKIDKDLEYPYLQVVKEVEDESLYFGPYTISKKMEDIKIIINETYKIRSCKKMTKCFKYDLGKCIGPCRNNISKEDYSQIIQKLIFDLQGYGNNIFEILNKDMQTEVEKLNFEKAAQIKQNIDSIKSLFNRQNIINNNLVKGNILSWIKLDEEKYKVYVIKNGLLIYSEYIQIDKFEKLDKEKFFTDKINNLNIENNIYGKNIIIDKLNIDHVNIIYSYIKYNNEINYIIL